LPDTATPTITPTPVVHVVQRGDTLQAIAFDFGVSVDALQRANGVENPQFLQVGQRLVIPLQEASEQALPGLLLPTPTPQPVQIRGFAFYQTPVDSLLGLGEVANTTAFTLTNVQLHVTLLDAAGEPQIETTAFASLDIVPPGARSPFRVLFRTPPPDWSRYQATVIRAQDARGALASAYVPLSVVTAEGSPSGPQFRVNGVVENVSAQRVARSVEVVVTTYDPEGVVTGFRKAVVDPQTGLRAAADGVDQGLPPGAEMAFSLSLPTHGGVPDDFTVMALGRTGERSDSGG
jgi:LysM repeat protein